jgi:hypothetical protein
VDIRPSKTPCKAMATLSSHHSKVALPTLMTSMGHIHPLANDKHHTNIHHTSPASPPGHYLPRPSHSTDHHTTNHHGCRLVRWEECLGPSRGSSREYWFHRETDTRQHALNKPTTASLPFDCLLTLPRHFAPVFLQPWVTKKGDPSSLWLVPYLL